MEAWIVLQCATRSKAYATQRLISRYGKVSRKNGAEAGYREFLRHVQDDLGFFLPNGSSYSESFRTADVAAVLAGCQMLAASMKAHDLMVFANSGTLLGLVREGTLLAHDNDIDLGVLLEARTEAGAAREWLALCDRLIAADLAVSRSKWSKVTLKLRQIGGFGVDLFPAWIDGDDKVYVYPHTFGNLTAGQLLPFGENAATGLKTPHQPEAMLVSNYGESWRVPNEGWTFGWPAANEKFAGFLALIDPVED